MTEALATSWPAALGNAAVAQIGHGLAFLFKTVIRNPGKTLAIAVLGTGMVSGSMNALLLQNGHHPAPLFTPTASIAEPLDASSDDLLATQPIPQQLTPVITPAPLPQPRLRDTAIQTPAPVVAPAAELGPVTHADVVALQHKLAQMGFFSGEVDGFYGPQTAAAIRAFETQQGLTAKGALTREVVNAVLGAMLATAPLTSAPAVAPPQTAPADDPITRIAMTAASRATGQAETPVQITVSAPAAAPVPALVPQDDADLVRMVQTGLARLGFFTGEIDGAFGAGTARAIREFENYNNYTVTGELAPELLDLLMGAGAFN